MRDDKLLSELLEAEDEEAVLAALNARDLLKNVKRWKYLGGMPNNQSIVHAQQSSPAAALVEKYTNGVDAILLRQCKAKGIDPRSSGAPQTMPAAVEQFLGDLTGPEVPSEKIREIAEKNLLLYATGSKARPSISLYDAGEGQLAENFPVTFCSLIYSGEGSYKGAIPFVQGRFNMGGTGVLPFCSERHKLQLIVSRVPNELTGSDEHEWAFTLFCLFPSPQDPSWRYLVGEDGNVLTAGRKPLALVPKLGAKSGEVCAPRERTVASGTLVKMYDFKAARSNICGEQFKKLEEYLLRPALPLRMIECRSEYKANVMRVTVWDRLGRWGSDKLEEGFEDGASIQIQLPTGEVVPAEVRVFRAAKGAVEDEEQSVTGVRALINGQSHAKRDAQFFRTTVVDKEHIAGSILVTLDCTALGQGSRNALFMSNRETFREDPLLAELLGKLQKELAAHEGLIALNIKRYEEKLKNAVDDEDGIHALEELLSTDPMLAELFGSVEAGKVAAKTSTDAAGGKLPGNPQPFQGMEYPTYIRRRDGTTAVSINVPQGGLTHVSFLTDVRNNYFTRYKHRGTCQFNSGLKPTFHLFNGRLTFTCAIDKQNSVGSKLATEVVITDNVGSGPFKLKIEATVVPPPVPQPPKPPIPPKPPKPSHVDAGPSRPNIKEVAHGPADPPLTIERVPTTGLLQLVLNTSSDLLQAAKAMRPKAEEPAVGFVFKYGLALTAMGLLDAAKKTDKWASDEVECRKGIEQSAAGIARVIVPLCLTLPKKLPKPKQ